ncbi:hypothetical protein F4561_001564 [Lipingzhangella halophila]|uniref:Uncharacterized protein n=1 Tax=Lipingzhangella halophila TaxID=1783352 RepID=A0A7W7RF36_9ACTN|nr:hypothetical protein [Lipingzhangella halophila]MBB4930744.1 hypothetical protein [Lipingzhangella halophila]
MLAHCSSSSSSEREEGTIDDRRPLTPAQIVPHQWDGVDTSIDAEPPELLSPEQLDRYVDTVTELLTAAGLEVRTPDERDPTHLEVNAPTGRFTVELDIRDDRTAEWSLSGGDEVPENTTALDLASVVVALLR